MVYSNITSVSLYLHAGSYSRDNTSLDMHEPTFYPFLSLKGNSKELLHSNTQVVVFLQVV